MKLKLLHTPKKLIRVIRSKWLSSKIDAGNGSFVICNHDLAVNIQKGKNAKIIIKGKCKFNSWVGGKTPINIFVKDNAQLVINGDFTIGHGVGIMVGKNAELIIGGCRNESEAGITCDTKILVNKKVQIGKDFICAWNVLITDSDWHQIDEQEQTRPVVIGEHVWIANNCSVLNGAFVGDGCIVASHSKLTGKTYPEKTLLGGVPAKALRHPVSWHRDMK